MAGGLAEPRRDPLRGALRRFPRRGPGYWLIAGLILVLSTWMTPFIEAHLNLTAEHNWLFQRLTHSAANPAAAGQARLVMLKDEEFWLGPLHHRIPTDRRYLAQVIRALDAAGASVIALDFDLRTPRPGLPAALGDYRAVDTYEGYRAETDELVRAIGDVAQRRKVVLAKTITGPVDGPFRLQSDAYQPYGICTALTADGVWANPGTPEFPLLGAAPRNISCGYIALMDDPRRVPPPARIVGQRPRVDAFSMAIVRARNRRVTPDLSGRPYFGAYIEGDVVGDPNITVSSGELLRDPAKAADVLQGWPVVVGAGWHRSAYGVGPVTDMHPTPIGEVSGALLHENLAEAVLSRRIFPGFDGVGLGALEVLTGAAAAVFFAAFTRLWKKLLALVAAMATLLALQWVILGLFGFFFDAFVPVFALGLHALLDRLVGEAEEDHPSRLATLVDRRRQRGVKPQDDGDGHDRSRSKPARPAEIPQ